MNHLLWAVWLSLVEILRFGYCGWWWRLRWALWRESRHLNVDHVSQSAARQNPELSYGETPTATLARILELSELSAGSSFLDLGCGRGATVVAADFLGYRAHGLELIEEYVEVARRVAASLGRPVDFTQGDMLEVPWPEADLSLLNSTEFPEEFRSKLVARLEALPLDSVVVTYDWKLPESAFREFCSLTLPVSRGTVDCRLFRRRCLRSEKALSSAGDDRLGQRTDRTD